MQIIKRYSSGPKSRALVASIYGFQFGTIGRPRVTCSSLITSARMDESDAWRASAPLLGVVDILKFAFYSLGLRA